MFDNQNSGVIDFDDLDLPDPEGGDEDPSDDPTVAAPTEALLAAVTARYETMNSVGELELELESDNPEPTLATPPVVPLPPGLAARPAPVALPAAPAQPSFPVLTVLIVCAVAFGLILGATWMALGGT